MVEYFDVNIEKKKLSATANLVIPSGNVNTYALRLHISGKEWENLAPIVAFYSKEQKYIVIATDNTYVIPASVLKTRGRFSFGVFATQLDNNGNLLYRFSTNLLQGLVIEGAYSARDVYEDNPEGAALYEQLIFQTNAIDNVVKEHISTQDNPHGVTAEQVGAYTKTETNDQITEAVTPLEGAVAGKLDKVSSFVRVYPGVYATVDTDGTPQLITATSDLSYIGASSGYIPLYEAGGQLKTATPTADDSAANKEYVDGKITGIEVADGNVVWGGKNREDSFGPIDAAMIPTLGANRFAFMPAEAIEVEYSRDGGVTWLNYEAADLQKISCFSGGAIKSSFAIGKSSSSNPTTANDQLRITLTQSKSNVYNQFYKFLLYVSTNSSTGCKVTIQGLFGKDLADETAYKTFVDNIPLNSGWGGYTVINNFTPVVFGGGSNHYGKLRFIFTCDGITTPSTTGLTVQNIYGFGGVGWKTPSNLAKFGYIYKWDFNQNVTFPNRVLSSNKPIGDSDLTNKKYVDGKIAALTNRYELIETITLTEATNSIERNSEPDGTAYNFKKLLIYMNAALTDQAGECGVHLWDGTTLAAKNLAFGSKVTTTSSNYMMELSVEDGILHQTTPERADTDYLSMLTKTAAATYFGGVKMMDKISKFTLHQFNSRTFAVGTVIKIYGVRA